MTEQTAGRATSLDSRIIAARIERLPFTSWHLFVGLIVASAWFFDAVDALAIAYVLPVLNGAWKLAPWQTGALIAGGYAGQAVGSIVAGWFAERWGRTPVLLATLLIFSLMSFACAFAWDFQSMLSFRFIQGIGLGGEVPIMITYINEFSKAQGRGKFALGIQVLFAAGLVASALIGASVVPKFGWQWMFFIGALPALIAIPLRWIVPESPRWLASKGRFAEADRVLQRIEAVATRNGRVLAPLPTDLPVANPTASRFGDLFRGIYLKRTISTWCLWICCFGISYGVSTWLPSIYRSVFKLPLQQSLNYGFIQTAATLAGTLITVFAIDLLGRRPMFIVGLLGTALPLLSFLVIDAVSAESVLVRMCICYFCLSALVLSLGMYTAEIYPNNMRALGSGVAAGWQRSAAALGPLIVGSLLPGMGLNAVFVFFGCLATVGFAVSVFFVIETKGRVLERLSPQLEA
jgi:MFS transporter, putative metabolite:H+ symporter